MNKKQTKPNKKNIDIETPVVDIKVDTGNKWLDAVIILIIIGFLVLGYIYS